MNAFALFAASFVVVFAMGFQQMNVTARLYPLAFGTSLLIGLSQLVQFKYLPGPTSPIDVCCFLFGNAFGIVAAMKAHPALMTWRARREGPFVVGAELDRVERRELEADIALEAAVVEIESNCPRLPMGRLDWWDSANAIDEHELDVQAGVDRAVRYLALRDRLIRHPMVPALLRFKP